MSSPDETPATGRGAGGEEGASTSVRVLIADDQRVVREGLEMILRFTPGVEVVGVAADGEEAVVLAGRHRPDVVLMDLRMPRLDGVEATKRLRETHPDARVIALTTYADESSVLAALQAGARGYLTKDSGAEALQRAIDDVMGGGAALDPAVQRHLVAAVAAAPAGAAEPEGPPLPDGLTPREAEVLTLIAEGLSNGEIAERLYVTQATVKSHVSHIFTKTRVRDRAQAVAYAYRHGLAEPS